MYGYIYETTNLVNGKKYIGQKKSEIFLREKYLGSGKKLKCAIKHYGKDKFKVKLIEKCNNQKELDNREIYWIANLRSKFPSNMIYNLADGGSGGMGSVNKGKPRPKEVREKISRGNKGRKMSDESRRKLSNSKKKLIGNLHPFYGKHHSKATREKMSKAHKGKVLTKKHRNNISKAEKGRKFSSEWKKNLSIAAKGKAKSLAHRKAISISKSGKIGINDGHIRKYISESDLQYYLERGWKIGYPKA